MPHKAIARVFADVRAQRQLALMPFVPAGFPDLDTTCAALRSLEQAGASLIEIGIPFSDPIADGPVIQEAFASALARGITVAQIFQAIARVRPMVSIPLVAMVSFSIVYRHGVTRFIEQAKGAGFDGLILPDLPPPECGAVCRQVQAGGLDTILLVSPTTPAERRQRIVEQCSGFVYYLSVSGITGERDKLPAGLEENLRQLRELTTLPLCVGFGVSKAHHLAQLRNVADGAIVGSGLVRRMAEHRSEGPAAIAQAAGDFCRQLLSP